MPVDRGHPAWDKQDTHYGACIAIGGWACFMAGILCLFSEIYVSHRYLGDGCCPWIVERKGPDGELTLLEERKCTHSRREGEKRPQKVTWKHMALDVAFYAVAMQLLSNALFLPSIIERAPGVWQHFSDAKYADKAYWRIRIAACVGFIISGLLNLSECSKNGWKPQLGNLGWFIALFKITGSVGFLVGSIMGLSNYARRPGPIASPVNCLWGSVCFLAASLLLLYESANRNSVRIVKKDVRRWPKLFRRGK